MNDLKTIGILGGGQLGRMLSTAAAHMGHKVIIYDPTPDGPAAQTTSHQINGSFEDEKKLNYFFESVDVVTYEFENILTTALEKIPDLQKKLFPSLDVLKICQNRVLEKNFLASAGIPVAPFQAVQSLENILDFLKQHPTAILKTATMGYDGKGQMSVTPATGKEAWEKLKKHSLIIEKKIDFDFEASIICARNLQGEFTSFPIAQNSHKNHILDVTVAPANLSDSVRTSIVEIATRIADKLDLVGILCIELFVRGNEVWVNELAPRPHNSGHYTLNYCKTSQFEQHLRAILNLPLGSTNLMVPAAAMGNLLGDIWLSSSEQSPNWGNALKDNEIKLHLYGKNEAKAGRKMGHLCSSAPSTQEAVLLVEEARKKLLQTS